MDYEKKLNKLNDDQKEAVLDESRACIVNANVGSGKTTVLISKIIYLHYVRNIAYKDMVVLTFTNKAANEIKERLLAIEENLDLDELQYFGTFHSVALFLLKNHLVVEQSGYGKDFYVIEPEDELDMALQIIQKEKLKIKYKNRLRKRLEQEKVSRYNDDLPELRELLKEEKVRQNKMSFSDLLYNVVDLMDDNMKPDWVMIDEIQDSDAIQLEFIYGLMKNNTKLFAVGDLNQVIYSWRGSALNVFYLLKEKYGARELSLTINYRSSHSILEVAKRFLQNSGVLTGTREEGNKIFVKQQYDSFQEACYIAEKIKEMKNIGIPYKEIAVFYRLQNQSEILENVFKKNSIPYEVSLKRTIRDIPVLNWLVQVLRYSINEKDISSGIYALSNKEYGTRITEKKAADIVNDIAEKRQLKDIDFSYIEEIGKRNELLNKMVLFREEFEKKAKYSLDDIYNYFNLDNYLHPTSSTFQDDKESVKILLNAIGEYINDENLSIWEGIKAYLNSASLHGMDILKKDMNSEADSVKLMTLHASKGLEFSNVFIIGVNYGLIPLQGKTFESEDEERRLFFVGITRARDNLELSYYINPDTPRIMPGESRFIRMIPSDLIENSEKNHKEIDLQELKRQIQAEKNNSKLNSIEQSEEVFTDNKDVVNTDTVPRKVSHDKYGSGIVVNEDDLMILVLFEDYGEKEFMKAFSELKEDVS